MDSLPGAPWHLLPLQFGSKLYGASANMLSRRMHRVCVCVCARACASSVPLRVEKTWCQIVKWKVCAVGSAMWLVCGAVKCSLVSEVVSWELGHWGSKGISSNRKWLLVVFMPILYPKIIPCLLLIIEGNYLIAFRKYWIVQGVCQIIFSTYQVSRPFPFLRQNL